MQTARKELSLQTFSLEQSMVYQRGETDAQNDIEMCWLKRVGQASLVAAQFCLQFGVL
jgi:hypothetical protein